MENNFNNEEMNEVVNHEEATNVVQFPNNETETPVEANEEAVEETPEEAKELIDPENPLNDVSIKEISNLLKNVKEMVSIMENHWNQSKAEFKLTDTHMKQLYQYNEEHRTEMPEGIREEEEDKWDRFNGLDNIPEEKVVEIFGEDHPIIGIEHTITIDRIKDCVNDFFSLLAAMKEYRQIHDAYLQLVEMEEQKNIEILEKVAAEETDPEKKAKMQESIDMYYNRKYLKFLSEPMDEKDIDRLVKAFSDPKKIEYWLNRTRDKLGQIKVSSKIILEISQFEKRFLPEKYHKCSNILLLYFMKTTVYADMSNTKDIDRNKSVAMVLALDGIIRKTWPEETINKVMENIMAMEDQLIDLLPEPTSPAEEATK